MGALREYARVSGRRFMYSLLQWSPADSRLEVTMKLYAESCAGCI